MKPPDDDKDGWEVVNKACTALMVAQAAGFVACLNLLKDYATSAGTLRGLPWLILLFGIGLVTAIVAYFLLLLIRKQWLNPSKRRHEFFGLFLVFVTTSHLSGAILVGTILGIAVYKFCTL
jgi:hypothetical protein